MRNHRVVSSMFVVMASLFVFLVSQLNCDAQVTNDQQERWLDRLVDNSIAVLEDAKYPESAVQYHLAVTIHALGQYGREESARKLLQKLEGDNKFASLRVEIMPGLADGLSSGDHLDAAIAVAKTIENPILRDRTLGIVAIRQSQRGNFAEAERVLSSIDSDTDRYHAVRQICREYVEVGKVDDAQRLAATINDSKIQRRVMKEIEKDAAIPKLEDAGYVEYQIQLAKHRPFGGASPLEIQFLEHYYRAEAALAQHNEDEFLVLAKNAQTTAVQMDVNGCRLMMGRLFYKAGRTAEAKKEYLDLFQKYAEQKKEDGFFELDKSLFGFGNPSDATMVVKCFSDEELQKAIGELMSNPHSEIVATALLGTAIRLKDPQWAEKLYQEAPSAMLKAQIALCSFCELST